MVTAADSPAAVGNVSGAHDPLSDEVAQQYERWVYPAPIEDLPIWVTRHWQWFDPSHAHTLMWPDREYPEGLDILVAGCGSNQAAVIAFTNPTAHVVGIDVSASSLAHHAYLADRHALTNLDLHRLPVERVVELDRDFDLIISTGVLHHLADPEAGMASLAAVLRPGGVLAVMLYATYGRVGVQMLQSVFRDLGLGQDEDSIRTARGILAQLDADHPVQAYLALASDWHDDAGFVDTFLHGRERTFTIDECHELVESAGLEFQDLFFKAPYYAHRSSTKDLLASSATLSKRQEWSVMERLSSRNACHYFLACRSDRPRSTYEIEFDSPAALDCVPSLRKGCRWDGAVIHRSDWQLALGADGAALVSRVDGRRSIRRIVAEAIRDGDLSFEGGEDAAAMECFRTLWQFDFLTMGIPDGARG